MFVEDYMTANPETVREQASLMEAAQILRSRKFRQLPVLDESRRLAGIITDRDIRQTVGIGEPLKETLSVADVMTADPQTISADATLEEAVSLLVERRFGALPVINGEKLVGIISYVDVLRAFSEVLAMNEPGHRFEIALPRGIADVAKAFDAIKRFDGQVLSAVVSKPRRDGGEPALYLRVPVKNGPEVERHLAQASMLVLEPNSQ